MTAGKKLVGKAIPQSDDTYLTTVQLRGKFIQLKKYLSINEEAKPENHEKIKELSQAISKLQEDVNAYKTVAETVTEDNRDLKNKMKQMELEAKEKTERLMKIEQMVSEIKEKMNTAKPKVQRIMRHVRGDNHTEASLV